MLDNFNISEHDTHVGIVEFSDKANIILPLNQLFEPNLVKKKVKAIVPSGGKEKVTDEALQKLADEVFDPKSGGRPGASKVLIIVTNGKSTGKEPPKRAVKPLKEIGVRVYVVNIGEFTDKDELKDMVPTEKNIYRVETPIKKDKKPIVAPKLVEDIKDDVKKRKQYTACDEGSDSQLTVSVHIYNISCEVMVERDCHDYGAIIKMEFLFTNFRSTKETY